MRLDDEIIVLAQGKKTRSGVEMRRLLWARIFKLPAQIPGSYNNVPYITLAPVLPSALPAAQLETKEAKSQEVGPTSQGSQLDSKLLPLTNVSNFFDSTMPVPVDALGEAGLVKKDEFAEKVQDSFQHFLKE